MGKKPKTTKNKLDPEQKLAEHIASLKLESVADYQLWCTKHGFATSLKKRNKMFACEQSHAFAIQARERNERARLNRRPTKDILLKIAASTLHWRDCSKAHHQRFGKLVELFRRGDFAFQDQHLLELLEHLRSVRSKILKDTEATSRLGGQAGAFVIETLVLIASHHHNWIRPIEQWKPRTRNARRQLGSLVRHLFDQYGEVPQFMDLAWTIAMRPDGKLDPSGPRLRNWYLHLGRGKNLRDLDLPIQYTKKMAHFFLMAPKQLTIHQALRWGQVVGMKGDPRLANTIATSRLADDLDNDDFWVPVIRWLADQPMLDCVQVAPMLDYIHNQKFVPAHRTGPLGPTLGPLEPNFTIKGRTVVTLMRQVEKWHRHLSTTNRIQVQNWQPCGIAEFEFVEGSETSENHKVWTIRELLSTQSLIVEGRQLRHCVASYASSCARGGTSIWTLEVSKKDGFSKLITLEVYPSKQAIVQARGKANRLMNEKERGIVRRWASTEGLSISAHF